MANFDKDFSLSGIEERELINQALATLLWTEYDWEHDEQTSLDTLFDTDDFAEESVRELKGDILSFIEANADDLDGMDIGQIAHDYILTRNGHGTGFWDRGLGEKGERLTKATKPFGEVCAYQGDDGKLYIS